MDEKLVRRELPIQSIHERGEHGMDLDDLTATVPVHLKILQLPVSTRTNQSLIAEARETVKEWFNEDMDYHLKCLNAYDDDPSLVKGYERFNDDWILEWSPDDEGFLELAWKSNGRIDNMSFCKIPIFLYNQRDENRRFYTPESVLQENLIECFGRNLRNPEVVFMEPEKMKKYGIESELARIDIKSGVAEVIGYAFCSNYQPHMGKALLLRDFAVFYLNKLLDKANGSST